MKAKLVKYPFNEKKYRWDTYKLDKEYKYYWDESLPNNFETIEPYIKTKSSTGVNTVGYIDLLQNPTDNAYANRTIGIKTNTLRIVNDDFYLVKKDLTNYLEKRFYFGVSYSQTIYHYLSNDNIRSIVTYRYKYDGNNLEIEIGFNRSGQFWTDPIYADTWENYTDRDFTVDTEEHQLELARQIADDAGLTYDNLTVSFFTLGDASDTDDKYFPIIIERTEKPYISTPCTQVQIRNERYKWVNWEMAPCYKFNLDFDYAFIAKNVTLSYRKRIINAEHLHDLSIDIFNYIYQNNNSDTNDYLIKHLVNHGWLDLRRGVYNKSIKLTNYPVYNSIQRINNEIIVEYGPLEPSIFDAYFYRGFFGSGYTTFSGDGWVADSKTLKPLLHDIYMGSMFGDYFSKIYPFSSNEVYKNRHYSNCSPYVSVLWNRNVYDAKILNLNKTLYIPTFIIPHLSEVYFLVYDENNHPNDAWYYFTGPSFYDGYLTRELNSVSNVTSRIPVDVEEWSSLTNTNPLAYEIIDTPPNTIYSPIVKLIGDKTENNITIPEGNTDILEYTLGEGINGSFVPKTLQVNAPCEYENGVVSSRTWLTFNSYTAAQWQNGFHFEGAQWNNIGSPFAYLNAITSPTGNRKMVYTYEPAEAGTYVNLFSLINGGFEVNDSLDNDYIALTDTLSDYRHYYDDNVGSLWYFGSGVVSSTDRNAYPDEGSQGDFTYRLRPQDTKFLRYYRTRDELTNVELYSDRYTYTHNTIDFYDASWVGRTIGTTTSTNEDSVPDGTWREYLGLYLGTSIPFLNIIETEIPPSEILGVPQYDKQVNTSDTLKYGTVASASLTFTLNKPVAETLQHNNELLILYYDFKNRDEWERLGFFRVDSIEALDENTTSLLAHDEVYKLNKYVDDFLEAYTQTTTLDLFYRDLLNYCGCFYDTHQDIIHNGTLGMTNVYHAVKTTGVQVGHYVANLSPGFIHANIDGDVVLSQYQLKDDNLTIADYANLVYTAYNTDMLNKIKIVSSNTVKGEDSGTGTNVYFLADNPLLSELQATSYFNELAQDILEVYEDIPTYRPATVDFLILPRDLKIGDIVNLTTPKNETYRVIVMAMTISSSGVQIKSFGTQSYPIEAESNSEFINLINDMGEISGDVSNMMEAQRTMATAIAENTEHIGTNTADIASIKAKNTQQDTAISNNANAIGALQTLTNGYGVSIANNLATITLNGTTNNITNKTYVDNKVSTGDTATLNSAKAYADSLVGTTLSYRSGTISFSMTNSGANKTCHCMFIGTNNKQNGLFIPTEFITGDYNRTILFRVYNGSYFICKADGTNNSNGWYQLYNTSFTED